MVEVYKHGKWITAKKIPQGLGTVWRSKRFVHGPRIRQPDEFSKLYTFSIEQARQRHIPLTKKPRNAVKAKVGPLRYNGRMALQSYLTPVRGHYRNGVFVKAHNRIETVNGSSSFRKIGARISRDPEIKEIGPPINIWEKTGVSEGLPGKTYMFPSRKGGVGFNIFIEKNSPSREHSLFHEIGHIKDLFEPNLNVSEEEAAERFAIRKDIEHGVSIDLSKKGSPSVISSRERRSRIKLFRLGG